MQKRNDGRRGVAQTPTPRAVPLPSNAPRPETSPQALPAKSLQPEQTTTVDGLVAEKIVVAPCEPRSKTLYWIAMGLGATGFAASLESKRRRAAANRWNERAVDELWADDAAFINDDALELVAKASVSENETTDDAASPNDDALLTALAVEQIATQKRDQTTTAQDVKRDVATRRETSKPNDENDAPPRQPARWKTAALAWFGSFAIFCAVATLTFALTRDASPTQTAATQTVASTVPASDVPQIAPPTPTQNAEPQAIAVEEPTLDDKTTQTPVDATFVEESQVDQTTQNAEPQAIAVEEPPFDDQTPVAPITQVETTQTLTDASFAPSEPTIYRKKISDVKIGERAVGVNPQGATPGEDDAIFERVKHCGYKLCYLKENGTTCEIELLRPVDWLDYERVQLRRKNDGKVLDELDFAVADILASGASVDLTPAYDVEIWLELPEMGVLGWATLTDVDENVAIQPGPGNVVTGTFAHVSNAVIDLQIEDQPKPIGCTTTHPFWSVDRQDFVEAGRLQQGERVQLYNGETKRVVQKLPRPGPVNVYNLEVYAEHVYRVTPDGVLVHNTCTQLQKNYTTGKKAESEVIDFLELTQNFDIYPNNSEVILTKNRKYDATNLIILSKEGEKLSKEKKKAAITTIYEIKNVRYQAYTSQLKDYVKIAQEENWSFFLIIKKRNELTKLTSQTLRDQIKGEIEEFKIGTDIWFKIPLHIRIPD